jgi:hypothetical protein
MALATEHGHHEVVALLTTPEGLFGHGQDEPPAGSGDAAAGDGLDLWEAEPDAQLRAADDETLTAVKAVQIQIAGHEATTSDEDWSDVIIDIPVSARRSARGPRARRTVVFRRLKGGRVPGISRANHSTRPTSLSLPDLENAMVALDLSQGPDEILGTMTLAQIVRGTDASRELRSCLPRSDLFNMTAEAFLADSDGETRFCQVPGVDVDDYLELSDLINAFTVLVHREASQDRPGQPWRDIDSPPPLTPPEAANDPETPDPDPDEVLQRTNLAQVIVASNSSAALRKVALKSKLFKMTAADFLVEDDAEKSFCSDGTLSINTMSPRD